MNKVRPYWGHNYHFHIRIVCPAGETMCQPQDPVPPGDGCDKSLDWWFTEEALHPAPSAPKPPLTLSQYLSLMLHDLSPSPYLTMALPCLRRTCSPK